MDEVAVAAEDKEAESMVSSLDKYSKKEDKLIEERNNLDKRIRELEAQRKAEQAIQQRLDAEREAQRLAEAERKAIAEQQAQQVVTERRVGPKMQFASPKEDDTYIEPEDEERIMSRYVGRQKKMSRREKKFVAGKEYEGIKNRQNVLMYFAFGGMAFIAFLYFYMKIEWMNVVLLYVGLMMFMPIGMIIGWALLDPYMRCKIMRRATHKNYGIVNFVGKGQKIVAKIKNFDDSLIWKGNAVWAITKEHIYQLSKNGDNLVATGKIDSESIVTLVDTVPVLFVDLDSMQPLGLARDRREGINPLELGPALKSWVDNEKAKALGLRKTMDMFFIVLIILGVASIGVAYISMNNVNDLMAQIANMQNKLNILINATVAP